jgi:hypothetical protein
MEFLRPSLFNTTTQISVNSNTLTAENLFNRDPLYQYYTDGLDSDTTTSMAVITITFDATTAVDRIAMVGMNFKEFSVFYNGTTASTFALQNADTAASSWLNNADANKYLRFSTIQCSSITINAKSTITANQEKLISLFVPSEKLFELAVRPSASGYKPKITPKQVVHKLSDGGTRIHNVRKKWQTSIELDYVSQAQRDDLFDLIYDPGVEFNFCPFGTATGWGGEIFEAVWEGDFNFYEFSDNAVESGYSGKINLKETPI